MLATLFIQTHQHIHINAQTHTLRHVPIDTYTRHFHIDTFTQTHSHRHIHMDTFTQTHSHRHKHIVTQTDTHRHFCINTYTLTYRQINVDTYTQTHSLRHIHIDISAYTQTRTHRLLTHILTRFVYFDDVSWLVSM